ncbi:MAG: hypothetical protein EOM90_11890 [Alphaproteobacteria bacterium]|nr:hypothetical protein [Alphaproteobacteria bacterium]
MNYTSLAGIVKANLMFSGEQEMIERMARHFQVWQLMQDDRAWVSPILESYGSRLLPRSVSLSDCHDFIDRMMELFLRNPFLAGFLEKVSGKTFPVLSERMKTEGQEIITDALAFAMALEKLTCSCYQDDRFFEECIRILREKTKKQKSRNAMPLFYQIKARSLEPVVRLMIGAHRRPTEKLGKSTGSRALQINILEATFSDLLMGLRDNAMTGWVLAIHKAGKHRIDPATDAGPNFWDENRKAIGVRPPLPRKWADLYQTWNMAFVSKMYDFPYIIAKLLIPQVADYQDHPETYMYNRVIALNLYMSYFSFDTADPERRRLIRMRWDDEQLTRLWGKINRDCAREYVLSIRQAKLCKQQKR